MATANKHRPQKGHDIDEVPASGNRKDKVRPSDLVDVYEIPKKWARIRPIGAWYLYAGHWVTTFTKEGKKTQFYAPCLAFDADTGKRDASKPCPWCSHDDQDLVRFSVDYWSNAIIRGLEKTRPELIVKPNKDERASGFKAKDSETWTPIRAVRFPMGPIRDIKDMKQLNVHENKAGESIGYPVSHPRYGCDIMVKKDPDAPPAKRYSISKSDSSRITEEESAYLPYDLSELQVPDSLEEAEKEYQSWLTRMQKAGKIKKGKSADGDDEDDDAPKKGKKRVVDEDDEDDDPPPKKKGKVIDEDDEDDEDDPPPKKKPKKPVDEDDEDDDPPPKKGKKPPVDEDDDPPPKKGKKPPVDEDEDEDDDPPPKKKKGKIVEDDDDDDEPPPKKRKPPVDEDDEDDEPPPKKKPAKKPVDEDEDEEDDPPPKKKAKAKIVDEDEDEDDEDDPPPKKKPVKKAVPAKKGKKPPVDEDEDEDEDEEDL